MSEEIKPWKCERQHVLGHVRRNGSGVRQLVLYRDAVDLAADQPVEIDVLAVVEGYVADVKCSICGSVRTWVPGQESMERLIRQLERTRGKRV